MTITKYCGVPDDVLEAKADAASEFSPLIAELLVRWRKVADAPHTFHPRCECPVCEAPLLVEPDEGNDRYELTKDRL